MPMPRRPGQEFFR